MTINQSPLQPTPVGALRFNTDSSKMEYYDGNQWVNITSTSPEAQTGGTRGITGFYTTGYVNTLEYMNISTTGNAADFGDLTTARANGILGLSSRTRGVWGCGYQSPANTSSNTIDYVTISSTGNATDFGDAVYKLEGPRGFSNETRGLFAYGFQRTDWAEKKDLQYITIASTGNSVDSGFDLLENHRYGASFSSPTRGIFAGGSQNNLIDYVTIATLSTSSDFGDLTSTHGEGTAGSSNAVRGIIFMGMNDGDGNVNTINYITIATLGNAKDFGDATASLRTFSSTSSTTRSLKIGGYTGSANVNSIDYVQIMTTGNAVDFGDLITSSAGRDGNALSNGHGGLG